MFATTAAFTPAGLCLPGAAAVVAATALAVAAAFDGARS
jgi:hypothetical protein